MRLSQRDAVRSMSAVLMRGRGRRIMTRENSNETLWTAMQAETQQYVKTELVAAVESEPQHHIRNKICDTLSDLAALELEHGGDVEWPELLPVMFNWTKSPRAKLRESALCIFANLANSIAEKLQSMMGARDSRHSEDLKATLADCVQDVLLAALRATGNFLTSIEDENAALPKCRPPLEIYMISIWRSSSTENSSLIFPLLTDRARIPAPVEGLPSALVPLYPFFSGSLNIGSDDHDHVRVC